MPTTFFGWVGYLVQQYGSLFLRGTGVTLLIAISGTVLGFLLGLLVAILRTIELGPRASMWKRVPPSKRPTSTRDPCTSASAAPPCP